MFKYITESLPKLNNQNNQYLELNLGKKINDYSFDTKINELTYNKLINKLQNKLKNKTKNIIKLKMYFKDNLSLHVNEYFQPKCF